MKNIKLRYYLRGLGIGVLVTAFIMTVAGGSKTNLTDAQIKERATELGMVDASSLVLSDLRTDEVADEPLVGEDNQPETENAQDTENTESTDAEQEPEDADYGEAEQEPEDSESVDSEQEPEDSESVDSEQEPEDVDYGDAEQDTENTGNAASEEESEVTEESVVAGDTVTLTIRSGANSYSVSKELESMGLVADAGAFDDYLCDNGYAKIVRVGTYKIVKGTSEEEIAKIITGKR